MKTQPDPSKAPILLGPTRQDSDTRFILCPMNGLLHDPAAIPIGRSKKKNWPVVRCGICSSFLIIGDHPLAHSGRVGYTRAELTASLPEGAQLNFLRTYDANDYPNADPSGSAQVA